jgi:hypothetical protein
MSVMGSVRDMEDAQKVSLDEAIRELSQPTGDAERDGIRLSFVENMQRGLMMPVGRGQDGEITVKLTPAGLRFVEEMGER